MGKATGLTYLAVAVKAREQLFIIGARHRSESFSERKEGGKEKGEPQLKKRWNRHCKRTVPFAHV